MKYLKYLGLVDDAFILVTEVFFIYEVVGSFFEISTLCIGNKIVVVNNIYACYCIILCCLYLVIVI